MNVDSIVNDLKNGTRKHMAEATAQIAAIDPTLGRTTLLARLKSADTGPQIRKAILECLHVVADEALVLHLARDGELDLTRMRASLCIPLYEKLLSDLKKGSLTPDQCELELARLNLLDARFKDAYGELDDEQAWKEAVWKLFRVVLDAKGLARFQTRCLGVILNLNLPEGDALILERFEKERAGQAKAKAKAKAKARKAGPTRVHGQEALLAWVRLRAKDITNEAERVRQFEDLFVASEEPRRKGQSPTIHFALFDDALTEHIAALIPERLLSRISRLAWIRQTPKFQEAIHHRVLRPDVPVAELIEVFEDADSPKDLVAIATTRLINLGSAEGANDDETGRAALTAIFSRYERVEPRLLRQAAANLSPADAFELLSPHLSRASESWDANLWKVVNDRWSLLRDPRWLAFAIEERRTGSGRALGMIIAIASDPDNASRDDAFAIVLERVAEAGRDVIDRRAALETLGETGHPAAITALLTAMEDPQIGSAMALTLAALGRCATVDTIPRLEKRLHTTWRSHIEAAIAMIRRRAARLSRDKIIAACDHPDPVIAELARAARAEDPDATAVLEDALRERGELLS